MFDKGGFPQVLFQIAYDLISLVFVILNSYTLLINMMQNKYIF